MKKLLASVALTIFTVSVITAQFTGTGGGVAFSSGFKFHNIDYESNKSSHFGVFLKGFYEISPALYISPSCSFFYPNVTSDASGKTVVSAMMFDINGHYVFNFSEKLKFHALSGLDLFITSKKDKYAGDTFKESDNALGLNVGAGVYFKLTEQSDLFCELKYTICKYDQLVVNSGVLINPDRFIRHKKP